MIDEPSSLLEAIAYVLDKVPTEWSATDYASLEEDVRLRSFVSSRVEDARFLDRAQGFLFDFLAKVRDDVVTPQAEKATALRIGGRADFVRRMREFMIAEGMATEQEMFDANQNDVTNIVSEARLKLIFDTNVRQAYGYGNWKQGQSPAVKAAFPAARLIRDRGVSEPRPIHQANLGEVRHKDDPWWAEEMNSRDIGGFEVPWGPYGFNSGVNQEDVNEDEWNAIRGATNAPEDFPTTPQPGLNDELSASTKSLNPDIKARLLASLRSSGNENARIVEENNRVRLQMQQEGRSISDE